MERSEPTKKKSEPTLVPEWLKGASIGVTSSGGTSTSLHQFASSLQLDDQAVAFPTRNWSSVCPIDDDSPRSSVFVDRTSSTYFRRSLSSGGSMMHDKEPSMYSRKYGSFNRSHRDTDREKRNNFQLDCDYLDSLSPANILTNKIENDTLRCSHSMILGKQGEVSPKRVANEVKNGFHTRGSIIRNIHKTAFDRDFPSLGAEETSGVPDIGRISSPCLSTACQSLPMGTLSAIGGEGWTSALAELPAVVGSNSTTISSIQQTAPSTSATMLSGTSTGLNMAETLAQPPLRTHTVNLMSVETQRLEELAIKQCRQLIPMLPSTPKSSVLNSSERMKSKATRPGESSTVPKIVQQLSSQLVNSRGSARSETAKASQIGKLQPLTGPRESNGASSTSKDVLSPTNVSRSAHGALRSIGNPKLVPDLKLASSSSTVTLNTSMDKKPLPQVQNRNEFFNSIRKKTTSNHSAAAPESTSAISSVEKSSGQSVAVDASVRERNYPYSLDPASESLDWSNENVAVVAVNNGKASEESKMISENGEQNSGSDVVVIPDEEEAAFLRRLGWEEDAKYEALTEEEISAFYNEHKEIKSAAKLCGRMQQLKIVPLGSQMGSIGVSGLCPSNSASEA